jgi:hypothetical protein
MNFHQAIEYIESSANFKSFFINNKEFELSHGFLTAEGNTLTPWEIGYYSKEKDKIIVFVAKDEIERRPEEEAFKKEGVVPTLDIKDVKILMDQARQIAENLRAKEHSAELVSKELVIIQTIDKIPTWNITLITKAFNMLNVRINATNGDVITSQLTSIMNLGTRT